MAWGRWLAFLTPVVVVAVACSDGPVRRFSATSEGRPAPFPVGAPCVERPTIAGDLRPSWAVSITAMERPTRPVVDGRGNAYLAGWMQAPIRTPDLIRMPRTEAVFVVAFDPDGRELWRRGVGPSELAPLDLAIDRNGTIIFFGSRTSPSESMGQQTDLYVAKLDASGNLLQEMSLFGGLLGGSLRVAVGPQGDFVLVDSPFALRAFDASGASRWQRDLTGVAVDDVTLAGADSLLVSGAFSEAFYWVSPPVRAPQAGFVAKLDLAGNVLGVKTFPNQVPQGLAATGTRAFISTGPAAVGPFGNVFGGNARQIVAAFDRGAPLLDGLWSSTVDTAAGDLLDALEPAADGGVFGAGVLTSGAVDFGLGPLEPMGMFVVRFDPAGRPVANALFHGSFYAPAIAADVQGNLYVSASVSGPIDLGGGMSPPVSELVSTVALVKLAPFAAAASSDRRCRPELPGALLERTGLQPVDMAMSETHLVIATPSDVILQPLAGGDPKLLAVAQDNVVAVALADDKIYWAVAGKPSSDVEGGVDGRIVSMPLAGGPPNVLIDHQDGLRAIAVDGRRLVYELGLVNRGSSASLGKVMSVPLDGGAPQTLVSRLLGPAPFAFAGRDVIVAASTDTPGSARILRSAEDGGTTQLALTDARVVSLAVDGEIAYLLEWSDASSGWRIRGLPLSGGPATVVASGHDSPRSRLVVTDGQLAFGFRDDFGMGLHDVAKTEGGTVSLFARFDVVGGLTGHGNRLAWFQGSSVGWTVMAPGARAGSSP